MNASVPGGDRLLALCPAISGREGVSRGSPPASPPVHLLQAQIDQYMGLVRNQLSHLRAK